MKANDTKKEKNLTELLGTVASTKMQKTVVVVVQRYVKHPKYHKYQKVHKRFFARDEQGICKEGDRVYIKESRPFSKHTRFIVARKAVGTEGAEINTEN